ncbi:MAG: 5-formyltetrahydrofolate cyclo-ligase [Peptoniphilaceae bacterium]|nr:5-formyltetrahydrofolate cyclo-ligase [Peptoniphilaceae bacterium]MDY5766219.1 5-formyltetrahydrofolate cyclo-ligase [Peptoniphilaceae bacterium]
MNLQVKRVYAPVEEGDGIRILVDRLWPRGIAKEGAPFDLWKKEIAPSASLRRQFHEGGFNYREFQNQYFSELDTDPDAVDFFFELQRAEEVTFVYAAGNESENNATALREWILCKRDEIESKKEAKKQLRNEIRQLQAGMSSERRRQEDGTMTRNVLQSSEYRYAGSIFLYISREGEPDTSQILRHALKNGKAVYAPKCGPMPEMKAVRVESMEDFRPGRMGILEPKAELAENPKNCVTDADLILVPCSAVSKYGKRLGKGGGYYDHLLRRAQGFRMCLCYEELVFAEIPATTFDEPVQAIVSGEQIIRI